VFRAVSIAASCRTRSFGGKDLIKIFHTRFPCRHARAPYAIRSSEEIDRERIRCDDYFDRFVTLTSRAKQGDGADNNKNDARYLFAGNVTMRRRAFLAADQATTTPTPTPTTTTTTTTMHARFRSARPPFHSSCFASDRAHAVYGRVSREPRPWNASKSRLALPKRAIHRRMLAEIFADVRAHAAVLAGSPAAIARVHVVVAARANEHSDIFPPPSPLSPLPCGPGEITSAICNKKYAADRNARARSRPLQFRNLASTCCSC